MPKLNRTDFFKFRHSFPPLKIQYQIAEELEGSLKVATKVQTAAQRELEAIRALPAATLREVFSAP